MKTVNYSLNSEDGQVNRQGTLELFTDVKGQAICPGDFVRITLSESQAHKYKIRTLIGEVILYKCFTIKFSTQNQALFTTVIDNIVEVIGDSVSTPQYQDYQNPCSTSKYGSWLDSSEIITATEK